MPGLGMLISPSAAHRAEEGSIPLKWSSPPQHSSELSEVTSLSYLGQEGPKELGVQLEFAILWQLQ